MISMTLQHFFIIQEQQYKYITIAAFAIDPLRINVFLRDTASPATTGTVVVCSPFATSS